MTSERIEPSTIARLGRFDTPTICNVIELFEIRPRCAGYMGGQIRAAFPELPPMVGFAATAKFQASSPCTAGDAYAAIERQLELISQLPGPAVVVFEDLDVPSVGATFGEVMCSSYQGFGSVGLITSGAGRDLTQVRALHYPVFVESAICSHAYCHISDLGSDVSVGGLSVRHGDLLHGDANGVTSIPTDIADEVADLADEFVAAEQQVIEYAQQQGVKEIAGIVELRRAMDNDIDSLRRRVSRA